MQQNRREKLVGSYQNRTTLSRKFRITIFLILSLSQLAVNSSSGLLSSSSVTIKKNLGFNDKEFGLFGTVFGIGRVLGSIFFMTLVGKYNRKYLLLTSVFLKSLILLSFQLTTVGWILISLRGLTGIFHIFISTYIPIWIDQFGLENGKVIMFGIIQLAIPSGKVTGFLLSLLLGEENWQKGFALEGLFFLFVSFFVFISPHKYFSSTLISVRYLEGEDQFDSETHKRISVFQQIQSSNDNENKKETNVFQELSLIFSKKVFMFGTLSRTIMMGINTAFHYWISDYMKNALEIEDSKLIFVSYTIMNILGPTGGILAGHILTKIFGNYENKGAGNGIILFHIIACSFGLMIPFMSEIYLFCTMTVLYFIFNSATLSMLHGIIITSVSPELKGTAFGFSNLFSSLLASGPSPVLYGAVNDAFKESSKNIAMITLMASGSIGVLFSILMSLFRKMWFEEKEKTMAASKTQNGFNDFFENDKFNQSQDGIELETKQ